VVDTSLESAQPRATPGLREWLFNPFTYIAGGRSLLLGLAVILLACLIGSFSRTHFDGVLDVHMGRPASVGVFLLEGIIDWLCLASVLFLVGRISSRSAFRAIDLFGTQALARWPTMIIAVAALAPPYQRFAAAVVQALTGPAGGFRPAITDGVVFAFVVLLILLVVVWMVALMYRSYSLCCNIRGGRAAVSFIIGLLVAEAVSKLALLQVLAG